MKFAIELQAVYLRGTTYLRTPLFGMIPVVTLFVVCAGAVVVTVMVHLEFSKLEFMSRDLYGHAILLPCGHKTIFKMAAVCHV